MHEPGGDTTQDDMFHSTGTFVTHHYHPGTQILSEGQGNLPGDIVDRGSGGFAHSADFQ